MSDRGPREQTASMEDYLEAVVMLRSRGGGVRVKHISQELGVKAPSVSAALRKLSEDGLVEHERYGQVRLTPAGEKTARNVLHRHEVLRRFLIGILGIAPDIAREDACRMEHSVSAVTLERFSKLVEFAADCPQERPPWVENYHRYVESGELPQRCPARSPESQRKRA